LIPTLSLQMQPSSISSPLSNPSKHSNKRKATSQPPPMETHNFFDNSDDSFESSSDFGSMSSRPDHDHEPLFDFSFAPLHEDTLHFRARGSDPLPVPKRPEGRSSSVSCYMCQKRKTKCDRGRPCSMCTALGVENMCSYAEARKRGPKPGSIARIKNEMVVLKQCLSMIVSTLSSVCQPPEPFSIEPVLQSLSSSNSEFSEDLSSLCQELVYMLRPANTSDFLAGLIRYNFQLMRQLNFPKR